MENEAKGNFSREESVAWSSFFGWIVGVSIAYFWPRIFGPEFLNYQNRLLVINPGTGLIIVTNFLYFLYFCYKIVRQKGKGFTLEKIVLFYGSITILDLVSLVAYAYNPATFILLGVVWVFFLGAMLFFVQLRTNQKPV